MKLDTYSLAGTGLNKEEINEILKCENREVQIRMLRKFRYKLLDEVHERQQSIDIIDYLISKMKESDNL